MTADKTSDEGWLQSMLHAQPCVCFRCQAIESILHRLTADREETARLTALVESKNRLIDALYDASDKQSASLALAQRTAVGIAEHIHDEQALGKHFERATGAAMVASALLAAMSSPPPETTQGET